MGVYIKGMTLDEFSEYGDYCQTLIGTGQAEEVPPHGRLIDADALTKMCREMQSIEWNKKASPYSWEHAYEEFENDIDDAPTIIETEEGEA